MIEPIDRPLTLEDLPLNQYTLYIITAKRNQGYKFWEPIFKVSHENVREYILGDHILFNNRDSVEKYVEKNLAKLIVGYTRLANILGEDLLNEILCA